MDNFSDSLVKQSVAKAIEKFWKNILKSLYKVGDTVLIANWINHLNPKKPYFKRETHKR